MKILLHVLLFDTTTIRLLNLKSVAGNPNGYRRRAHYAATASE